MNYRGNSYGPLEATHHRIRANEELVRYIGAVQVRTKRKPTLIVIDACIAAYAPDLDLSYRHPTMRNPLARLPVEKLEWLMLTMRAAASQRAVPFATIVEDACIAWMEKNVVRIDGNGVAILQDDQQKMDEEDLKSDEKALSEAQNSIVSINNARYFIHGVWQGRGEPPDYRDPIPRDYDVLDRALDGLRMRIKICNELGAEGHADEYRKSELFQLQLDQDLAAIAAYRARPQDPFIDL
jgi:hypothetical protein